MLETSINEKENYKNYEKNYISLQKIHAYLFNIVTNALSPWFTFAICQKLLISFLLIESYYQTLIKKVSFNVFKVY